MGSSTHTSTLESHSIVKWRWGVSGLVLVRLIFDSVKEPLVGYFTRIFHEGQQLLIRGFMRCFQTWNACSALKSSNQIGEAR